MTSCIKGEWPFVMLGLKPQVKVSLTEGGKSKLASRHLRMIPVSVLHRGLNVVTVGAQIPNRSKVV